ncbi:hypothetical protein TYRP_007109 [Tyrophagus putrescentiae]|nr:hypothetical protein TYRP_007109 [Tyrophagus putrescentiae]
MTISREWDLPRAGHHGLRGHHWHERLRPDDAAASLADNVALQCAGLVFVVMLACQTAAYLFGFACCIHITESLHRAELVDGLGRLQMRLTGRRHCAVKFKLAVLYERVQCSEQLKFGFKVGPLSSISWRTVFEFSFVYTGFIMFFASILLSDKG